MVSAFEVFAAWDDEYEKLQVLYMMVLMLLLSVDNPPAMFTCWLLGFDERYCQEEKR